MVRLRDARVVVNAARNPIAGESVVVVFLLDVDFFFLDLLLFFFFFSLVEEACVRPRPARGSERSKSRSMFRYCKGGSLEDLLGSGVTNIACAGQGASIKEIRPSAHA